MHEAKCFNDKIVDSRQCYDVLTKIEHLMMQGESFTDREVSNLFFSVTKLFNSRDVQLRRMVYLALKDLPAKPEEAMMVVNSLAKDMTGKVDSYRANSLRVLAKILDPSMVAGFDRLMKQAIVDRDPSVVSAALLAGNYLFDQGADSIRRWTKEVQVALTNPSPTVQLHALLLLFKIKQYDQMAIKKLAAQLARSPPKGPLAQCLLIRCVDRVIRRQETPDRLLSSFLHNQLSSSNFTVAYEAARTICSLPNVRQPREIAAAVGTLQDFLGSHSPVQRYAAVRTLSRVVLRFPTAVAPCNVDLEHLISDPNRNVATIAITTLLRTGVEQNVDRLMKSISGFMSETSDEHKIVLVDAIKGLCLKFPDRHQMLMSFLAAALREEGGKKFKQAIVEAMLEIVEKIPETKGAGLEHFCEFIEDCEFPRLSMKILDLLGSEGPSTKNPGKYIRFIFNRIILETASVRSAAVTALAKFGAFVPSLTDSIRVLLSRCVADNDDEVRDRAILFLHLLSAGRSAGGEQGDLKLAQEFFTSEAPASPRVLMASLEEYLKSNTDVPFDVDKHLLEIKELSGGSAADAGTGEGKAKIAAEAATSSGTDSKGSAAAVRAAANRYRAEMAKQPYFTKLGPVFKSSDVVELTESETEYVVTCVKHNFRDFIAFQFYVVNNMDDQRLEDVSVLVEPEDPDWAEEQVIPAKSIGYQETGVSYVVLQKPRGEAGSVSRENFASGPIACTLKFQVQEVENGEPVGGTTEDEYQLEDLEVIESDFVLPITTVRTLQFRRQWETLAKVKESVKKCALAYDDLQAAVDAIMDHLGMGACESTREVSERKTQHEALLTGKVLSGQKVVPVLCRAGFMLDQKHGCRLKIAIRSPDPRISQVLINCVR